MADFILEIFSEEIPALMQKNAAENFAKIAKETFGKNNFLISEEKIKVFVTPNRLTLYLLNISLVHKIPPVRKVGPKISSDKRAIEGFLKSCNLNDIASLETIDCNGHICYVFEKGEEEIKTADIIKSFLPQILQKMTNSWPKLMRWNIDLNRHALWIRPVRNICAMIGDEVVDLEFFGLKSNNITFGHSGNACKINNAQDYREILEDNFVIVDREERKNKIIAQVRQIKSDLGLELIDDEKSALFDEVAGLCQFPCLLVGEIDKKFMTLPKEVLVLTLKLNQKYICLQDEDGNLSEKFIFVSNAIKTKENAQKIISDNEKLVKARLSDAEFFINEDLKTSFANRVNDLKSIIFHQKLGSIFDKVNRINSLSKFLAVFIPHCDLAMTDDVAFLCKNDLTSKMVAELPELQGRVGGFYILKQLHDKKIANAVAEHYLPLGPTSDLPKTPLGIMLAIADKIDSTVGFFLANEKPTSSKDPYALRRAVLGVIRISFQNDIAFPIRVLIEKSLNAYPTKLTKDLLSNKEKDFYLEKKQLIEELIIFFVERLKVYLKENEGLRPDIVNAVIDEYLSDLEAHKYCDILYLAKKVKFLDQFILDENNKNIIELYKRSANILAIEEKKDGRRHDKKITPLSLKNSYEKTLYKRIKQIRPNFQKLVSKGDFEAAFKLLHILELPLKQFFDNIIVNDKDKSTRENRLALLAKLRALFNFVADLSKIEI
jgi:glycyl-tRNA synthetase beta chain